ncbi:tRNA cyclic N6-threonylcarbamoyladenosine(37) synthase TcdA [Permianibacter aggregans]|uniref:tRNA threonylcarbamoyladenosine dehydratase n=1 Tax=Permianibacter aggregans TaxID=1510150 RepID=A0A4R6UVK0_9GAMM|nr:tRNA cyclic N6-threonylcarbamoyladenosine(37) synthase TcdA [Permianibacter aggregans]QGX41459.1 tRNA cyclic N6-threonylcarbamoyladenosine(37) synthase TcdA [Permianibacter aggregans]TDQ51251.1 tRNA A37 threonylcarbamoyladenosine dehydratase [Permianibacter aggregans]
MNDSYAERFGGIQRLYGASQVERFRQSHVCIVGIGGVGSWAAEAIARTGIGRITLIDLDDICVTNTNRQIQALSNTIGQMKTDVLAERIRAINPACEVIAIEDFLTAETLDEYLSSDFDVVIDCIDSVKSKAAIINACKRRKIPLVTVGGAGGQIDPTRIQVADLAKAYNDPLLARVKTTLRREYGFPKGEKSKFGVECIFSSETLKYPQLDGSVCATKVANTEGGAMKLDCNTGFGAAVMVTGSFGFFAAARAIEKLLKKPRPQPAGESSQ